MRMTSTWPHDQGSPCQVERHLSGRCNLGTNHYPLAVSAALAFKTRLFLWGRACMENLEANARPLMKLRGFKFLVGEYFIS